MCIIQTPEDLFSIIASRGLELEFRSCETIVGFHGTSAEAAKNILNERHFRPTAHPAGYIGSGAYFWETSEMNGCHAGILFARHYHKFPDPVVVSADLKIERLLDLGAPENEPYLNEVESLLVELMLQRQPDRLHELHENDAAKYIAIHYPEADGIQAFRYRRFHVPGTNNRSQWALAIRDSSCISDLKQVYCNPPLEQMETS